MQGLGEVEQEHPKPPGSPSLPLPTPIPCRLSTGVAAMPGSRSEDPLQGEHKALARGSALPPGHK